MKPGTFLKVLTKTFVRNTPEDIGDMKESTINIENIGITIADIKTDTDWQTPIQNYLVSNTIPENDT